MFSLLPLTLKFSAEPIYYHILRNRSIIRLNRFSACFSQYPQLKNDLPRNTEFSSVKTCKKHFKKLDLESKTCEPITLKEVEKAFKEIKESRSASPRQLLIVIRCCAEAIPEAPPEKRIQLVQEIWETFEELDVQMDVRHYNALLKIYIENEHPFVPTEFLAKLEEKGIAPQAATIEGLIIRYCQTGNVEEAKKLLMHMHTKGMSVTEDVHNMFIMGYCNAKDVESAEDAFNMIKQIKNKLSSENYTILLCGYIKSGKTKKAKSLLTHCKTINIHFTDKDYYQIIYCAALFNNKIDVDRFIPKLRKDTRYFVIGMNYVYRLISARRKEVAFKILLKIAKSTGPEFRESIGYSILEIVKQLKNGPNAIEDIEHTFEDLLIEDGRIGPRSAESIFNHLQDILTPRMSSLLAQLRDRKSSKNSDTIVNEVSASVETDEKATSST